MNEGLDEDESNKRVDFSKVSAVNIYYLLANDTVDDIIWMLDGNENSLEVSASELKSIPSKQGPNFPSSSPGKQKTLDSFVKRCNNIQKHKDEPNAKQARHC
ncbi:hypothetical protein ACET3Z_029866 [Daucus carota]